MKGCEPTTIPLSQPITENTAELVIGKHEDGTQTIRRIIPRNIKINVIVKE